MKISKLTTALLTLTLSQGIYAASSSSLNSLVNAAKKEGNVYSIGMPDS